MWCTHEFAIKGVLLDHNGVDDLRVPEREKAEATRATTLAITHDSAFDNIAELCEVVFK